MPRPGETAKAFSTPYFSVGTGGLLGSGLCAAFENCYAFGFLAGSEAQPHEP